MLPLCSAEIPAALLWSPQHKKDMNHSVQSWATKMIKKMDHLSQEKMLRELGLFSMEKERLCRYLKGPSSACKRSTKELERNFLQGHVVIE